MKAILGRALSPSLAVSALALSVALGGGAWAAAASHTGATPASARPVTCSLVRGLHNGWKNFGNHFHAAEVCKDSLGFVHLAGVLTGGTADSTAFVLPRADRPRVDHAFSVAAGSGAPATENVDVFSNGDVFLFGSADPVAIDGVTFRAGD